MCNCAAVFLNLPRVWTCTNFRYGLHETVEALRQDMEETEGPGLYRPIDLAELPAVREVLESALKRGLSYGMPMRVTMVESS
jgi:hypothetical protein